MIRTTRLFAGKPLGAFAFCNMVLTANSQDRQTAEERALIEHSLACQGPPPLPRRVISFSSHPI